MIQSFVIGFPRIGQQRELKKALENFWQGKIGKETLLKDTNELKIKHWNYQKNAQIDIISSNDFSFYDNVLDAIITFGCIPERFKGLDDFCLYFAMARGNEKSAAMEMTKWFNTNYHYIVPEINSNTRFSLNSSKIINEYNEAKQQGINTKINIIGPITFLALAKSTDNSQPIDKLQELVEIYKQLLKEIVNIDKDIIIQLEEPIFVTDRSEDLYKKIKPVYSSLSKISSKILFMTYFQHATQAVKELINTDVWGIGLDFVYGEKNYDLLNIIKDSKLKLFAGIIDGRNIWKSDIEQKVQICKNMVEILGSDRLFIGTSCSLLHVPYTLKFEKNLGNDVKNWLSFAIEKLDELTIIKKILNSQKLSLQEQDILAKNKNAILDRKNSPLIHDENVWRRIKNLVKFEREGSFKDRIKAQREILNYQSLPTTTIGSFPQTSELRQIRNAYKKNLIDKEIYENDIKKYICDCIKFQEDCGLDILVHGEPERNDMVEYFAKYLNGCAFSDNGWVQSYGSRCVKPPIIFGDVSRKCKMSVDWIVYAQSQTTKPVKGMLTGPITILNWSFIRDDIKKSYIAKQLALCIYDEISDLQDNGIKIIQVDEAAFKEGYPLRKEDIKEYEKLAIDSFKLSISSAKITTQIHTHMCYSEFNDIICAIQALDADVISIETARSKNELLKIFKSSNYVGEIGPGVYDIHSPRVPTIEEFVKQIREVLEVLPKQQVWINPDCGLKTRKWDEVKQSLKNMVQAAKIVREFF